MDAKTRPISRLELRKLGKRMREAFAIEPGGALPVLAMLDKLSDVLPGCKYVVVEDSELPPKTMAHCYLDGLGYTIKIKESVYAGAYEKNNGAFLGFICHEICHVFLFMNGYAPILERSFENFPVPAYRSVEWQAKALCGEVMVPFEESVGLSAGEIERRYLVSKAIAKYRWKLGRR